MNGGMKDGVMKQSTMPVQPAIPNAPTENDLIASKFYFPSDQFSFKSSGSAKHWFTTA